MRIGLAPCASWACLILCGCQNRPAVPPPQAEDWYRKDKLFASFDTDTGDLSLVNRGFRDSLSSVIDGVSRASEIRHKPRYHFAPYAQDQRRRQRDRRQARADDPPSLPGRGDAVAPLLLPPGPVDPGVVPDLPGRGGRAPQARAELPDAHPRRDGRPLQQQ